MTTHLTGVNKKTSLNKSQSYRIDMNKSKVAKLNRILEKFKDNNLQFHQ